MIFPQTAPDVSFQDTFGKDAAKDASASKPLPVRGVHKKSCESKSGRLYLMVPFGGFHSHGIPPIHGDLMGLMMVNKNEIWGFHSHGGTPK